MIIAQSNTIEGIDFLLWKIEESIDYLNNIAPKWVAEAHKQFRNEKRKLEYIIVRLALKQLFGKDVNVQYDQFEKPFIIDYEEFISISHSGEYILVAKSLFNIGVDIERISSKLNKVKHKFCSEQELKIAENLGGVACLGLIWSAKEALYKAVGNYPFLFNKEMHTEIKILEKEGKFKATVYINTEPHLFKVHYYFFEEYTIAIAY